MQRGFFDDDGARSKTAKAESSAATGRFSKEYTAYLKSPQWQKRRKEALERVGYRCEHCKKPFVPSRLQLHHRNYERLGKELPSDTEVLCDSCHKLSDAERREQKAIDNADKLYEAQVYGWGRAVYGEDWEHFMDFSEVAEEFELWLERKGEGY